MNNEPESFLEAFFTGLLALIVAPVVVVTVIYLGVVKFDAGVKLQQIAQQPVETVKWQSESSK